MQHSETRTSPRIPVVGIGASAGGIDALRQLFTALPSDLGVAYVVVVHLAPDYESELAAILGRSTPMSVVEVKDHQHLDLSPNCVYVIAPDRKLEITDDTVAAASFKDLRERRATIDVFFRSLAEKHADGFAVVLSGGGSDGALGARAVKDAGGVVLVQAPQEAAHEAMPRSVIAADVADVVLPVKELAARLVELVSARRELGQVLNVQTEAIAQGAEAAFRRIFELVRARTGHDFSGYKRPTIVRRLGRRMQLNHCANFDGYLTLLRENPDELRSLLDDLLISVTAFFRDPEVWEALRVEVVAPLVEAATADEPLRVWVPACATGEEVYTLAILFHEELSRRESARELVVFASDVDQSALATAREGCYPLAIAADVSEARLARYFRAEGDHYRVASEIRDSVVFAAHNVLRDPPFSKLHLISCRNLLIYLNRELQQQVQHVFRYALRDDGYLLIGISEAGDPELFEPVDKQRRIFRASGPLARLSQLPEMQQVSPAVERVRERALRVRRSAAELHVKTLERFAPPSALVDEHWNIEHLSETAGRFLQPRGGPPAHTLMDLVRPELVDELRTALHRAFESNGACLSAFVPVRFNGTRKLVGALVHPRPGFEGRTQRALVTFLEAGDAGQAEPIVERKEATEALVLDLREKLRVAEQRLETLRQEHALAYEHLRAANEELQSLNEEYRSTTEELETSKEERQSVNEELQTVNIELKLKLEEVSRANNDLENFMAATDIPMLFLDRDLRIKRYTAALQQIFAVRKHDQGRPISDLTHNLIYDDLVKDANQVLSDLVPVQRQITSRDGGAMTVRIRPYRTTEDKTDGVVLTFVR
jgi:two-component system CheB/CheR fusion protein